MLGNALSLRNACVLALKNTLGHFPFRLVNVVDWIVDPIDQVVFEARETGVVLE